MSNDIFDNWHYEEFDKNNISNIKNQLNQLNQLREELNHILNSNNFKLEKYSLENIFEKYKKNNIINNFKINWNSNLTEVDIYFEHKKEFKLINLDIKFS